MSGQMTDPDLEDGDAMDVGDTTKAADGAAAVKDVAQLHLWNDEITYAGNNLHVHDLIEKHITQEPSAPSVCAWDGEWTYAELDKLSSALASNLIAHGIGCEDFVPLYFYKSKWTAVAILAVVRSGAAFVLLDDAHPLPRLREICSEMKAILVVAAENLEVQARQLVDGASVVLLGQSSLSEYVTQDEQTWRASPVTGASALYAIFTSGSTGRPKGAVIEHASLCATAVASGRVLGMSAQTRAFQFASYAFDPTIMDFLRTWIYGACVCIPSPEQVKNDIAGAFTALQANMASLTPSVARMLDIKDLNSLGVLELAGEPMLPSDLEKWADHVTLVNAYGNAECSVYTVMQSPVLRDTPTNSIGFPVACVAWIVDDTDADILLPLGQAGELVLEGPAVGRGYLNNAEMTATSFIRDPAWLREFRGDNADQHRLYKTGDLAKFQCDGSILCLGRKDTQVKIRGQRIELGEVEWHVRNQLHAHDEVVAEVVRLDDCGTSRAVLVAYVRLHDAMPTNQEASDEHGILFNSPTESFRLRMEEVERVLKARVPAYMVPSAFVALNYVPLSISGKTDRKYLKEETAKKSWSEIEGYMLTKADKSLLPTTDLEKKLQDAFAHVLGLDREPFDLHQSFFRRGGDSILAMQLSTHCRAQGLPVTTQEVFQYPTISSLKDVMLLKLEYQNQRVDQPFSLSPAQHLLLRQYKVSEPAGRYTLGLNTFCAIRVAESVNLGQLESAIRSLVRRHPALRTSFAVDADGQWAQVVNDAAKRSFLCLSKHAPATDVASSLRELVPHCERLDLHDGPLLLAQLIEGEGNGHNSLILVAPKLVVDGPSWEIIIEELSGYLESREVSARGASGSFRSWLEKTAPLGPSYNPLDFRNMTEPPSMNHSMNRTKKDAMKLQLEPETAALLWRKSADVLWADAKEVFMGVLLHSFKCTFPDRDNFFVLVESDGRSSDVSGEVGQFTTYVPLELSTTTSTDLIGAVGQAKDAYRAASRKHDFRTLENGHVGVLMGWKTKVKWQDAVLQVRDETSWSFDPSRRSNDNEASALSYKLGTLDVIVEQSLDSFDVNVVDYCDIVMEDDMCRWFERCQHDLAELPKRLEGASLQPRLSDFPQLCMNQENLVSLLANVLSQNPGVETSGIEDMYPVSFIQQGMLLSQARDPRTYRSLVAWRVESRDGSPIDMNRLQRAWKTVSEAHSILRTVFVQGHDGAYYQVVLRFPPHSITALSVHGKPLMELEHGMPHGEESILPWMLHLAACGDGTVTCELQISHALIDGDSMRVLARDVALAYDDTWHKPHGLPRYGQYIELLSHVPSEHALGYWETHLQDLKPCIFPSHPRAESTVTVERFRDLEVVLGDACSLRAFCEKEGVTLFNVVQLAWAIVLQCYTGNENVAFGYLTSGRDVPIDSVEDMVGPLINMLISRVDLGQGTSIRQGLEQCRVRFMQSLPHQHCALSDIYRVLGHSGAGLFNTIITHQKGSPLDSEATIALEQTRDEQPTEVSQSEYVEKLDRASC